jgi:hypothetical protein
MADAEIEQKREEDERLDTAEDPNEEVRCLSQALYSRTKLARVFDGHATSSIRIAFPPAAS